ncbi:MULTISPECIES: MarR family winged helix-turn-helix transcriptional regulator [Erysipelotrichaceae]|uniref:MarR family winged helix-turn-helix transcriptional regulator n=1 Tax=Erysipelotrichaceae TaxID=128827 RepID=UPI000E545B4E|nr:helix-turn-helix domain-containing protein [Absiella sp. AM27-20]RHU04574.1 MarR family transcriptional regulator [Absiella sp. AM27-20]
MDKTAKKNAYLYCKFRDEQFALYDEYAKRNGLLMNTLLVLNVLYYAKEGMTQKEICQRTFNSKQTVNLIIKNLLKDGYVELKEDTNDKRNKLVVMTNEGKMYAKIPVTHITWAEDKAMSMFSEEEQELLIRLSRKFTQNLTMLINGGDEDNDY